ncbi:MAG: hypothetical protein WDA16_15105 [Candidatus Thermoplasmatota archaeon]
MDESPLPLLVDELFDVEDAIRELERRKEKLRAGILDELRRTALGGIESRRGSVALQAYSSFKGLRASQVLPFVMERGWTDDALFVNGRGIHKLASPFPAVMDVLRSSGDEHHHEGIVMRLRR